MGQRGRLPAVLAGVAMVSTVLAGVATSAAASPTFTTARVSVPGKKKPPKKSTGTTLPTITKLPVAACPLLSDDEAQSLMGGASLTQAGRETSSPAGPMCSWGGTATIGAGPFSFQVSLQLKKNPTSKSDFAQFKTTDGVQPLSGWGTKQVAVQINPTAPPQGHGEIVLLDGDVLVRLSATSPSGVTASQLDTAMRSVISRIK